MKKTWNYKLKKWIKFLKAYIKTEKVINCDIQIQKQKLHQHRRLISIKKYGY